MICSLLNIDLGPTITQVPSCRSGQTGHNVRTRCVCLIGVGLIDPLVGSWIWQVPRSERTYSSGGRWCLFEVCVTLCVPLCEAATGPVKLCPQESLSPAPASWINVFELAAWQQQVLGGSSSSYCSAPALNGRRFLASHVSSLFLLVHFLLSPQFSIATIC